MSSSPTGSPLTLGLVATSRKPDEKRLPLHPLHLERVEPALRRQLVLEAGYGDRFGLSDAVLAPLVREVCSREQVLATADVVLLPKPQVQDLEELPEGAVLWGWPHCVQDRALTQVAIDRRLTLVAFEAMNHWKPDGSFALHVFHKNNELAGYASVLHAMELIGSTGVYGRRLRAVVIGFGATARGAVTALTAHGIHDVRILTNRDVAAVASPIHSAHILQIDVDSAEPGSGAVLTEDGRVPLAPFLAENDIVVNCTLQDPEAPLTYLRTADLDAFRPGSLVVDVSCDEGMGFGWARPTSFAEPMFTVGDHIRYYAVDHSPSYLWDSATWEISEALLPFLGTVLAGPSSWEQDENISRAVEIRGGRVVNPAILSFQGREPDYPHAAR